MAAMVWEPLNCFDKSAPLDWGFVGCRTRILADVLKQYVHKCGFLLEGVNLAVFIE